MNTILSQGEAIKDNYSSYQLLTTLDICLYNALDNIIEHSDFIKEKLCDLLSWHLSNRRRKISIIPKDVYAQSFVSSLTRCIFTSGDDLKENMRKLKLDRNIVRGFILDFIAISESDISRKKKKELLKIKKNKSLYVATQYSKFWIEQHLIMRERIMQKYYKFIYGKAKYYAKRSINIDRQDLIQNLFITLTKGIDKCSTDIGTLTSYLETWFKSGFSQVIGTHEYNIAYTVPFSKRVDFVNHTRASNIYTSLEDIVENENDVATPDDIVIRYDDIKHIRDIARFADPVGLGRYHMGFI
jgi:hypothetical protein